MKKIVLSLIVAGIAVLSLATMDYALALDCHERFIFAWHTLNPVLDCLDSAGGGASALNDLTDVTVSNVTNTQILIYNSTSSQWENENQTSSEPVRIGQIMSHVFQSITKTNIGTSYTAIYTATFDSDVLDSVDFSDVAEVRVLWAWDYVGTGQQQCRWVNRNLMTAVLFESSTFTADQTPNSYPFGTNTGDSGWFTKPSNFNGELSLLWQCKSTVAGDDPIAKGYVILVR